jgi:Kdo2-lipid IVA lauroyltransferase/acyltransferase
VPRSALRPLRQRVEVLLLRLLGFVARAVPFEAASGLGARLGRLAFVLVRRRREIAIENVRRCLGDPVGGAPAREIARQAFAQIGRTFLEFLALPSLGREGLRERVSLDGFEPLLARAARREGTVLVTGHYGNWEMLGATLLASGIQLRYLLPPQTNPGSDAYLDDVRRRLGIEPVKLGFGMRHALRALRAGEAVALLADQDARRIGMHVPFFGRPASTLTGPARLAISARCPIAVGFAVRTGPGRYRARLTALLEPRAGAGEEEEVLRLTREITALTEQAVRERPDQWYWVHRRWKTPPPAEGAR